MARRIELETVCEGGNEVTRNSARGYSCAQLERFAEIELFIRHVRNFDIGPHPIRAEAVAASVALEHAMGGDYEKLFETETWKKRTR